MATNNALNNKSAPFTVTSGDITTSAGDAVLMNISSATTSPISYFKKNRAGAALTSGDLTGTIKFSGYEGTSYIDSARITSTSSGTIATNRVAGDLKFYTHPDSVAADPTLRMTIASTGAITIASPDTGTGLTVSGGGITATSGNITATSGNVVISAGNLTLPTSTSSVGQIQINSVEFIHALGTGNTFIGYQCGSLGLTTGSATYNTGAGRQCLDRISTGNANACFGALSAQFLTSGTWNTFCGTQAGYGIGTGSFNTAISASSLYNLNTGSYNIAIGSFSSSNGAGSSYTSSESSNIVIGNLGSVGESNKIRIGTQGTGNGQQDACYIAGIYNTAVGATAGVVLSDSSHQLGGLAGAANTIFVGGTKPSFTATPQCTDMTLTGVLKLPTTSSTVGQIQINSARVFHTYGTDNIFIGKDAGNFTLTSARSVAIGEEALKSLTSGVNNTGIGYRSGTAITTGSYNTGLGLHTHRLLTTGDGNCAFGNGTLDAVTGSGNTAFGRAAMYQIGNASNNIAVGYYAGQNCTGTDSSNIIIGNNGTIGDNNKIRIGTQGSGAGQQNATFIAGIYNTAVGATAGVVLSDSSHQLGGLAGAAGTVLLGGAKPSFSSAVVLATGGSLDTSTSAGNTLLIRAYDVDGTAYKTFATLTANDTPTMDLDTDVTIATKYIYRADGTDVPVADGGTGASTLTDHGVLLGSGTSAVSVTAVGATGEVFVGSTGADPGWSASPSCTDLTLTGTLVLPSTEITADTYDLAINKSYVVNNANKSVCQLPGTAPVGSWIEVVGKSANMWEIESTAAKNMHMGASSTSGVGGSVEATQRYSSIVLKCITADADWVIVSNTGTIAIS